MDKERFHNEIAMRLGYERIVKDKRIMIAIEDTEEPCVSLKIQDYPEPIRINASDSANGLKFNDVPALQDEIRTIADAVHQAYIEANRSFYINI